MHCLHTVLCSSFRSALSALQYLNQLFCGGRGRGRVKKVAHLKGFQVNCVCLAGLIAKLPRLALDVLANKLARVFVHCLLLSCIFCCLSASAFQFGLQRTAGNSDGFFHALPQKRTCHSCNIYNNTKYNLCVAKCKFCCQNLHAN